jgi:hypothetical protein
VGWPRIVWQNDVFALSTPADAEWLAEEERVCAWIERCKARPSIQREWS